MIIKQAILKALEDLEGKLCGGGEIYEWIVRHNYYDFGDAKTPKSTVHSQLGEFIRTGDSRVKRLKDERGKYKYYLAKYEDVLDKNEIENISINITKRKQPETYRERDLHTLLTSYLKSTGIYAKTIFHEKSRNSVDSHQKWIHPDMVGIKFLTLRNSHGQNLLRATNKADVFKLFSYEIKKEINTDYDLKKYYFQAVSNSSWANYGYLVAFEISDSLKEEMERLNQSFGIGIIELSANPFESKVLYTARLKAIDYKTIDKLCQINSEFEQYIQHSEALLTASDKYRNSTEKELADFCDIPLKDDQEILEFCVAHKIPHGGKGSEEIDD